MGMRQSCLHVACPNCSLPLTPVAALIPSSITPFDPEYDRSSRQSAAVARITSVGDQIQPSPSGTATQDLVMRRRASHRIAQ